MKGRDMENTHRLHGRAVRAAIKFLERRDYEIIEKIVSNHIDIVALDEDDNLHFVKVEVSVDKMPKDNSKEFRDDFEKEATEFLIENPYYVDCEIIFDTIDMVVVKDDRAFLRFHTNCLSEA